MWFRGPCKNQRSLTPEECDVYSQERHRSAALPRSAMLDPIRSEFRLQHMALRWSARFKLALDYKHASPPE